MHLLALLAFLKTSRALLIPSPPGPYDVAVRNFELVDTNRIDTFATKPNIKRRLMVSAYLPIDAQYGCKDEVVSYVPALTAEAYGKVAGALGLPDNIVKDFEMKVCKISSVKPKRFHKPQKDYPVALFSPGYQGSRLVYGAMARSLASLGYIILTMDHTYEALVVEFPDGTAATAAEFPDNMTAADPVPGWNAFYDKIDAAKMEMVVNHTRHYAFTDVPLLLTEFKIPAESEAQVHEVFGTLGGRKVEEAANEIMVGFLDLLYKKDAKKLEGIGKKDGVRVLQRDLA